MTDTSFSHLIVIGSSAGGIDALSKLLATLSEDFPAPLVIAQHLDPDRESHLQEILKRPSKLPVRTVTDHEPLEAGVTFVVPANRHVNISDSAVDLRVDSSRRPTPSVDLLLESAAEVYGERLIAVVLTGTGSDGTAGARAVKMAGGTVIIQDPKTAKFAQMPESLAPNDVDIIADIEKIGQILNDLLSGAEVSERRPQEDEKQPLERLLRWLREQHGIDFSSYKTPTLLRRLTRRMVATDSASIDAYTQYVADHPEEYQHLLNSFLIKVTQFFRDTELFTCLKEELLPELIREAQERGSQLRIWSAGCATGEEAYSLAILLAEVLGSNLGVFNVRIFATDVDEEAINYARRGIYAASALKGLSQEQIQRYFIAENGQYQIKKQIRSMIVFGEHDLAQRSPFPHLDLVLSRNVLIYFTQELQKRALQLFAYSLRDGGYLVLGKAETTSPLNDLFVPWSREHKIYRRQGERFTMPPSPSVSPAPTRPKERRGWDATALRPPEAQPELQRMPGTDEAFLQQLPVGMVIVNQRYDIQAINATARTLLSIHGAAVGEDFLHSLPEVPYAEIRRAIDEAFRDTEPTTTSEFAIEQAVADEPRYVRLYCYPLRTEGHRGTAAETVMIVVHDVTLMTRTRQELQQRLEETRAEFEQLRRTSQAEASNRDAQIQRLIETNRRLDEANRRLTEVNEELQNAYEEALISTEEAQAATEEVETLNEELQATNEELETLNEELQATIEELNTTNDDLHARSAELQDLAQTREEERQETEVARQRLEASLQSMSDAVLAVNSQGNMLFSNGVFNNVFGEDSGADAEHLGDFVPLDENGERLPPEMTPQARGARGESFTMRFAVEEGGARRLFEAKGQPIDSAEGGGVILIREV